ncbi:MAG: hypothetical protein DDT19_01906 [Syntrophomonadaceae bacterium]|nr:hypothetical protein [Bacillota bacterium]
MLLKHILKNMGILESKKDTFNIPIPIPHIKRFILDIPKSFNKVIKNPISLSTTIKCPKENGFSVSILYYEGLIAKTEAGEVALNIMLLNESP